MVAQALQQLLVGDSLSLDLLQIGLGHCVEPRQTEAPIAVPDGATSQGINLDGLR